MKKLTILLVVLTLLAIPMSVGAQSVTTNTAFQVVNLNQSADATVTITFYDANGGVTYAITDDTIAAGSSKTYIQSGETNLGTSFDGSVIISSDQEIAAIVNQNTADATPATTGYNGSYTGFSEGSDTFYIPIVLNAYYGYHTEISVQNASTGPVDVTVTYDTAGCTDVKTTLAVGAAVRFDNTATCSGGLSGNGSASISATGPVVAVVNQIGDTLPSINLEQTYNGFAPANSGPTLYTPIALHHYYTFNSSFQVQNISGGAMDICATYSDGLQTCVNSVADGAAATFLQEPEAHAENWGGSATITNTTGGDMVGIVNQASGVSASSFNMYTAGATNWALPSLLYQYYGFTSAFQVQNVSNGDVDITVTYDDGTTASALAVPAGGVAPAFVQDAESGHAVGVAFSAMVVATGDIVIVVNQDVLLPGAIDYQYSYNATALTP